MRRKAEPEEFFHLPENKNFLFIAFLAEA